MARKETLLTTSSHNVQNKLCAQLEVIRLDPNIPKTLEANFYNVCNIG